MVDDRNAFYCIESTVVQVTDECLILRPGAVSKKDLETVAKVSYYKGSEVLSPGVAYKHYSPKCPIFFVKRPPAFDPDTLFLSYNTNTVRWGIAFIPKKFFF